VESDGAALVAPLSHERHWWAPWTWGRR
jgi:hypothetical protein